MMTVWSNGFCQFTGSPHYRPGTWQSRISVEQYDWLTKAAKVLGLESSRRRTATQSLIMTQGDHEWRVEERDVVTDERFWIVSTIIDGIASAIHWAPLDASGDEDYYEYSLNPAVYLESRDSQAKGYAVGGGVFVIAGAVAASSEASSLPEYYQKTRRQLIDQGVLSYSEDKLVLIEHMLFDSPSKAACILTGSTSNGRQLWKTLNGDPIARLPGYAD